MGTVKGNAIEEFPPLISRASSSRANGVGNVNCSSGGLEKNVDSNSNTSLACGKGGNFENPNPSSKNWRSIFPAPRPVTPQPKMKFTPPTEINGKRLVVSSTENFSEGVRNCENLVVGFFVGKRGSFKAVQKAIKELWKLNKEVSIKLYGNCAFIFDFKDEEDRKNALETGSFFIGSHLFSLRPWTHLLEKSISEIKTVPIWAKIFGVPLHMWNNDGLSLIASFVGVPLFADDCTLNKDRLAYARICVEIEVDFNYPATIPMLIDGKISMELPVEYDWKPPKCDICKVFGHTVKNCSIKNNTRWTPKKVLVVHPVIDDSNKENGHKEVEGDLTLVVPAANERIEVIEGVGTTTSGTSVSASIINSGASEIGAGEIGAKGTGVFQLVVVQPTDKCKSPAKASMPSTKSGSGVRGAGVGALSPKVMAPSAATLKEAEAKKCEGSSQGDWIEVIGKKKINSGKLPSPKRNPFMVYSDFKEESRFPTNRTKEMEARKVVTPSRMVVDRMHSQERVVIENDHEEESDDMNDCEFEKTLKFMSIEDSIGKRKERELNRLKWNGKVVSTSTSTSKETENPVTLGRGQRSQVKKRYS